MWINWSLMKASSHVDCEKKKKKKLYIVAFQREVLCSDGWVRLVSFEKLTMSLKPSNTVCFIKPLLRCFCPHPSGWRAGVGTGLHMPKFCVLQFHQLRLRQRFPEPSSGECDLPVSWYWHFQTAHLDSNVFMKVFSPTGSSQQSALCRTTIDMNGILISAIVLCVCVCMSS